MPFAWGYWAGKRLRRGQSSAGLHPKRQSVRGTGMAGSGEAGLVEGDGESGGQGQPQLIAGDRSTACLAYSLTSHHATHPSGQFYF